jgi:hypothetical protein
MAVWGKVKDFGRKKCQEIYEEKATLLSHEKRTPTKMNFFSWEFCFRGRKFYVLRITLYLVKTIFRVCFKSPAVKV